jgi:CRISPR-associated endonuclease Cas2
MRFVVTYDISHDAVRLRVADFLGAWGLRVQESVFECTADPAEVDAMVAGLQRLVEDGARRSCASTASAPDAGSRPSASAAR